MEGWRVRIDRCGECAGDIAGIGAQVKDAWEVSFDVLVLFNMSIVVIEGSESIRVGDRIVLKLLHHVNNRQSGLLLRQTRSARAGAA